MSSNKKPLALLLLSVDGVMTNGKKTYCRNGTVLNKQFHDHDFTAIARMKGRHINVCFVSRDRRVNEVIALENDIDFVYTTNKLSVLDELLQKYQVELEQVAFIGDDYYDIALLKAVRDGGGEAICPNDAPKAVRDVAGIINRSGGDAVVMKFFEENEAWL